MRAVERRGREPHDERLAAAAGLPSAAGIVLVALFQPVRFFSVELPGPVLQVRVAREATSGRARALVLQQERFASWVDDAQTDLCALLSAQPPVAEYSITMP